MHGTELRTLTTEELLHHVYAMNFNVPVRYVQELHDRLSAVLDDQVFEQTLDSRQLELPL